MANLVSLASLDCLVWLARLASLASLACLTSPVSLTDETGLCQDLVSNHVGMADLAGLAGYTILYTIPIDRPVKLFRQARLARLAKLATIARLARSAIPT